MGRDIDPAVRPEPWIEPFRHVTERIVQWLRAASQWPVRAGRGFGCRALVARRWLRRRDRGVPTAAGSRLRVRPVMDGVPRALQGRGSSPGPTLGRGPPRGSGLAAGAIQPHAGVSW